MNRNLHWSVYEAVCLEQVLDRSPPTTHHQEGTVSQPLDVLQGSGNCLETLLNSKRR